MILLGLLPLTPEMVTLGFGLPGMFPADSGGVAVWHSHRRSSQSPGCPSRL